MGTDDRLNNAAEDLTGKAKEGWGKATDNEQLEAEGKMDQGKAAVKDKVEDVKDAVAEKFNDMTDDDNK
ncbi:MAG: CsbD family protein [Actinomycetota bacterium]